MKSSPYHPQANGAVERLNQTLKNRLFAVESSNFDERLTRIIHAINCAKHTVTGVSPFLIENGRSGENLNDFINHSLPPRINMQRLDEQTHSKIVTEKAIRTEKFKNENYLPFEIGDQVLIKNMTTKFPRFLGLYRLVSKRGLQLSYEISNDSGQRFIRHVSHLKQYNSRDQPDCSVPVNVSDDNPSEHPDTKAQPETAPGREIGAQQQSTEFLFENSNFYSAGFIIKPLRPKNTTMSSNSQATNERQVVENTSKVNQVDNVNPTLESSNMSKNDNSSSSESDLSVISRSDVVQVELLSTNSSTRNDEHVEKHDPQHEDDNTATSSSNISPKAELAPPDSRQSDSKHSEEVQVEQFVENYETTSSDENPNADLNETPVLPRSFSLRDCSKIRHPSRPLDQNFQYEPNCSTPKPMNFDNSLDCTKDELSTPKSTSLVQESSFQETSETLHEGHVENNVHRCPAFPNEYGTRIVLSKFTKSDLIALATKLQLQADGSSKTLMETIDRHFRKKHPTWPRTSKGSLIITKYFKVTKPMALVQFTKEELKEIFAHFHLEAPKSIKPKNMFLTELERKLRKLFPDAKSDQNGSFILTEKILHTTPKNQSISLACSYHQTLA